MNLPKNAFPKGHVNYGRNYQIIDRLTIEKNQLIENTFSDRHGNLLHQPIRNKNGHPIIINPKNCAWMSQTFFRNEDKLYGFSLIEKGGSTKLFLSLVKTKVDFDSFIPVSKNFSKDKNHYYYGPGGKVIKEVNLKLYFDETYKKELPTGNAKGIKLTQLAFWRTRIATTTTKVYWDGSLLKGVHSSLKRITPFLYADKYNIYSYDLHRIRKIEGVDMESLVFFNYLKNNSIHGMASDRHKPIHCYTLKREVNEGYDFRSHKPLFEAFRGKIDDDYWWYKVEKQFPLPDNT